MCSLFAVAWTWLKPRRATRFVEQFVGVDAEGYRIYDVVEVGAG